MERYHYGTKKLIGGEFELNSFPSASIKGLNKLTHCTGTWTTNGRSALYLILQKLKSKGINQIHLPAFLCQSILQPVLALELDYTFYPVQPDLTAEPDPPKNSAVLLIHYFGFINNATEGLRKGSGKGIEKGSGSDQKGCSIWVGIWFRKEIRKGFRKGSEVVHRTCRNRP